ncbi:nucleoside monophosphate kinase, partial [Candidatus Peregrinibacteria bacterium]|nr:nucleoside monophosphate kinase [Candidatus Peregrinibacteria bacterium]
MDLIFFGMQGAGKGTVGKVVAEKLNLKIFETGGALRVLAQEDSELGKKIKSIIEAGHLVPNEVVMEIVEDFINKLEPGQSVLFDGIPRSIEQAESLNMLLSKHDREYKAVLIDITEETALERLTTRKLCSACKTVYPGNYESETCNATK